MGPKTTSTSLLTVLATTMVVCDILASGRCCHGFQMPLNRNAIFGCDGIRALIVLRGDHRQTSRSNIASTVPFASRSRLHRMLAIPPHSVPSNRDDEVSASSDEILPPSPELGALDRAKRMTLLNLLAALDRRGVMYAPDATRGRLNRLFADFENGKRKRGGTRTAAANGDGDESDRRSGRRRASVGSSSSSSRSDDELVRNVVGRSVIVAKGAAYVAKQVADNVVSKANRIFNDDDDDDDVPEVEWFYNMNKEDTAPPPTTKKRTAKRRTSTSTRGRRKRTEGEDDAFNSFNNVTPKKDGQRKRRPVLITDSKPLVLPPIDENAYFPKEANLNQNCDKTNPPNNYDKDTNQRNSEPSFQPKQSPNRPKKRPRVPPRGKNGSRDAPPPPTSKNRQPRRNKRSAHPKYWKDRLAESFDYALGIHSDDTNHDTWADARDEDMREFNGRDDVIANVLRRRRGDAPRRRKKRGGSSSNNESAFWEEDGPLRNLLFGRTSHPDTPDPLHELQTVLSSFYAQNRHATSTNLLSTLFVSSLRAAITLLNSACRWASVRGALPQPIVVFLILAAALSAPRKKRMFTVGLTIVGCRTVAEALHGYVEGERDREEEEEGEEEEFDGRRRRRKEKEVEDWEEDGL